MVVVVVAGQFRLAKLSILLFMLKLLPCSFRTLLTCSMREYPVKFFGWWWWWWSDSPSTTILFLLNPIKDSFYGDYLSLFVILFAVWTPPCFTNLLNELLWLITLLWLPYYLLLYLAPKLNGVIVPLLNVGSWEGGYCCDSSFSLDSKIDSCYCCPLSKLIR